MREREREERERERERASERATGNQLLSLQFQNRPPAVITVGGVVDEQAQRQLDRTRQLLHHKNGTFSTG
jgi:hypothetical protein